MTDGHRHCYVGGVGGYVATKESGLSPRVGGPRGWARTKVKPRTAIRCVGRYHVRCAWPPTRHGGHGNEIATGVCAEGRPSQISPATREWGNDLNTHGRILAQAAVGSRGIRRGSRRPF
jgi:hypothetical protein